MKLLLFLVYKDREIGGNKMKNIIALIMVIAIGMIGYSMVLNATAKAVDKIQDSVDQRYDMIDELMDI